MIEISVVLMFARDRVVWGSDCSRMNQAEPLIFVNYRSRDDGSMAFLVKRELSAEFGDGAIFLDFESIPLGQDFSRMLLDGARRSAVLLVLIGRDWEGRVGARGRLIDDPGDWVRREIAAALAAGVVVVPVLIGNRPVLVAADLPVEIARLARLQYARIRHRSQGQDLAHLVDRLKALPAVASQLGDTPPRRLLPSWALALGVVAMAAALVLVFVDGNPFASAGSSTRTPTTSTSESGGPTSGTPVSGVTMDQPVDGAIVDSAKLTANGVAHDPSSGLLCVVRDESGNYFPYRVEVTDGWWKSEILLGPPKEIERAYSFDVILAGAGSDEAASAIIRLSGDKFTGIGKVLPPEVTPLIEVHIVRAS